MELKISNLAEIGKKISQGCISLMDSLSKEKLKVALISYYYQKPTKAGVAIHVQNLAKYLVKNNCEVHVFCHGDADAHYKEDGAYIHVIGKILTPVVNNFSKKRLEYVIFESEVIKEITRENLKRKFDIIHTHGGYTMSAFILKKVYDIAWVHTFHSVEKLRFKKLDKEEKEFEDLVVWVESTANHCDGAIFVSKNLLNEGEKNYKLKSKKVIYNGVDPELFNFHPITHKNVLFIGRFSKEKGIDLMPRLIEEVMALKDSSFTAVCTYATLGGELEEIRKVLTEQEKKYGNRLNIITTPQSQDNLIDLYKKCQVYIQPSKYESFGLCILEAMAIGRPVIAFKVGGVPEVIGNCGFAVKSKNAFIYKLKELLNNKKECVEIGKKANKRAKNFDWDLIAKQTIKYYGELKR